MNDKHILLVEDDEALQSLIEKLLINNGYTVSLAINIAEAEKLIRLFIFDLIILDVMLPDNTGLNFYENMIKNRIDTPVIFLSALSDVDDRIAGLELGADDYIGKPFDPKELLLRVKNVIKVNIDPNQLLSSKIGEAELNLNKMTIKIKDELKRINSSEKKVLMKMLSSPGKIFSRTDIGKIASISKERSIDVMITRLRKKIELDPKNPKFLQTIRGSGYVLWVK